MPIPFCLYVCNLTCGTDKTPAITTPSIPPILPYELTILIYVGGSWLPVTSLHVATRSKTFLWLPYDVMEHHVDHVMIDGSSLSSRCSGWAYDCLFLDWRINCLSRLYVGCLHYDVRCQNMNKKNDDCVHLGFLS